MINLNFYSYIMDKILSAPEKQIAYVDSKGRKYSFDDFNNEVRKYQYALLQANLNKNSDVICLVPSGNHLISVLIACFSLNNTVVFIDPKLGIKRFYQITKKINSVVVVYYKTDFIVWFLKIIFKNLQFIPLHLPDKVPTAPIALPDNLTNLWLIDGFTSGTTGETKRIRRQHIHMIKAAHIFSKNIIPLNPDNHMIGYTLSALRNLIDQGTAFEMPKDKKNLLHFITTNKITRISGPPSVSFIAATSYLDAGQINLDVKNIILGGAPVQRWLLNKIKHAFPNALIQNIYGCTECEPISHCTADEMLNYTGLGYFAGKPVPELRCEFQDLGSGLFELIVHGEHVTIDHGHRTGDLIRKLNNDSIVLVGRKNYLITNESGDHYGQYELETAIENKFDEIKKAAVLQKNKIITIYIELFNIKNNKNKILQFIEKEFEKYGFKKYKIVFIKKLPYDQRHHWKVLYHQL
jgi:acyl-coenzyme A synthetase/AMP-(fatty) acid ligase